MKRMPIVALIGQTNAGKSSLLNRLARKNIAIVAREEGTTRDNVVTTIDNAFVLVDTAGLKDPTDDFEASIQEQIRDAIDVADILLVTLDGAKYFDHRDAKIAKDALRSKKPVLLVLNKCDLSETLPREEFRALGIAPENIHYVSAMTGRGIGELKAAVLAKVGGNRAGGIKSEAGGSESGAAAGQRMTGHGQASDRQPGGEAQASATPNPLKIALIGRPNVGKSSLFNTLGKKQQAVVSSRQGTTRDVNRLNVRYKGGEIEVLDTAGLRKPGKREVGVEKFSAIRTLAAIEEADVCCLLIDATEPHSKLDQALAGQIVERGKGIIVVVTKADLLKSGVATATIDEILDDLERDFDFIPYAPVVVTSAETGQNATRVFELAREIQTSRQTEIKTSELNRILNEAVVAHPPAGLKNTRPKPKYIVQTDTCPPWFVVHGRELGLLHWSWKRYLERKIRERYPFVGTPIMLSYRSETREPEGSRAEANGHSETKRRGTAGRQSKGKRQGGGAK